MEKFVYYHIVLFLVVVFLSKHGITTQETSKTNSTETVVQAEPTSSNSSQVINETVKNETSSSNNATSHNETETSQTKHGNPIDFLRSSDAVLRAVYVASGIFLLLMIYTFCRIRRNNKKNKWHKYGLLKNSKEVEMMPLGTEEEEDEENLMFDARTYTLKSNR